MVPVSESLAVLDVCFGNYFEFLGGLHAEIGDHAGLGQVLHLWLAVLDHALLEG